MFAIVVSNSATYENHVFTVKADTPDQAEIALMRSDHWLVGKMFILSIVPVIEDGCICEVHTYASGAWC